jgi:superfamily I DNA/RNA helicase/RecB family exonuclease
MEQRVSPEDWPTAIADTDGFQIVVAGPGTGKSEFLVRRAHHIVSSGLARRDEIVVLSFSRRASGDLRSRIDDALGAFGVPIDATTFHSLSIRLQEAASDGVRPTPLTTPEQVRVVARILAGEDPENWPLPYRGILETPAFAAEAADFLMRCSERLLTPEGLAERARERADWRGLPGLYKRYLDHLSEIGRTDYGVLLSSAVEMLRSDEGHELATSYRYVIVDEYQDTSPAQAAIADLLAVNGNLTVTGDPYQSIYSFRGAEVRNVADFTARHPNATRIVLDTSFRVPEEILDSALKVVSSGDLPGAAGPVVPAEHQGRVEAYVFDQETAEAEWIAAEVERAIQVEKMPPSSIAVLVRSKKELLNELSRALSRRDIPHDPPDTRLVDHPAVRLFHDLSIVASHGGALPTTSPSAAAEADRAMRRILLGPLFGISLSRERHLLRERRRTWSAWALVLEEHVDDLPGLAGLVSDSFWATDLSAADGFWHAWSTLDKLEELVTDPQRSEWRRAWTAFAQVLDRQAERDKEVTLSRFFEMTGEEDFEATPLISHKIPADRVALTTLHQAKGLEFDVVFIANSVEGVFPDLRRSRRMLRPELLSPERTTDPAAQHLFQLQEEMRLAYTAITRARLRVVWTATDAGVDQGENRPSRFLIAAAGAETASDLRPPLEHAGEPVTLREAETRLRRALLDPEADRLERLMAATLLGSPAGGWWDPSWFAGVAETGPDRPILGDSFRLSPSQATAYETCPRRYALERRLRLGDADSPWAQFGSLIHTALEVAEDEILGTGKTHADLERALEVLNEVWAEASFGTPELDQAWLGKAREVLTKLYENWPTPDAIPEALETHVELQIDGIRWVGKVDRVERTGAGLRVVDYKTSTTAATKKEAAESVQLGFYASAIDGEEVIGAEFWYPRTTARSITTPRFDMERMEEVREKMVELTRAIRSENWEPNVGRQCNRCAFKLSCPAWPEGRGAFLP